MDGGALEGASDRGGFMNLVMGEIKSSWLDRLSSFDVCFRNKAYLLTALTHKSYAYENIRDDSKLNGPVLHNEKFEFLGDAVLDLVLSEFLMETFPHLAEGPLSKMRAHLVNESGLALIATELGLQDQILLGRGEVLTQGAQKPRLLASCFEALMGAYFADQGFEAVRVFVRKLFALRVEELRAQGDFDQDFKSRLQEKVQAETKQTPVYELKSTQGPAHDRIFEVRVLLGEEELAIGIGKSKKAAEQDAAEKGLQLLHQRTT
jgi:ribonuclease-3